jgi:hypothetical protein
MLTILVLFEFPNLEQPIPAFHAETQVALAELFKPDEPAESEQDGAIFRRWPAMVSPVPGAITHPFCAKRDAAAQATVRPAKIVKF